MKVIKFEGYLKAPEDKTEAEKLEDRLLDVVIEAFNDELEMMASDIEEVEDE